MAVLDFAAIVQQHDLREINPTKYFRDAPGTREHLEKWYLPAVKMNAAVRRRLREERAEYDELGDDETARHRIAGKVGLCHALLGTQNLWSMPEPLDYCRQGYLCQFCIPSGLRTIARQFSAVADLWRGSRKLRNVQLHRWVFHPQWYNHKKNYCNVQPAFEAIAEFRRQVSIARTEINDAVSTKPRQRIGPVLWGIHCLPAPNHPSGDLVPIPHLHLYVVTCNEFSPKPFHNKLRDASQNLTRTPHLTPDQDALQYKIGDSVTFDDDPSVVPGELKDAAAYAGRVVKQKSEQAAALTAVSGWTIRQYAGGQNCGVLGVREVGVQREPIADQFPIANKSLVFRRDSGYDLNGIRIYRNPLCYDERDYDR